MLSSNMSFIILILFLSTNAASQGEGHLLMRHQADNPTMAGSPTSSEPEITRLDVLDVGLGKVAISWETIDSTSIARVAFALDVDFDQWDDFDPRLNTLQVSSGTMVLDGISLGTHTLYFMAFGIFDNVASSTFQFVVSSATRPDTESTIGAITRQSDTNNYLNKIFDEIKKTIAVTPGRDTASVMKLTSELELHFAELDYEVKRETVRILTDIAAKGVPDKDIIEYIENNGPSPEIPKLLLPTIINRNEELLLRRGYLHALKHALKTDICAQILSILRDKSEYLEVRQAAAIAGSKVATFNSTNVRKIRKTYIELLHDPTTPRSLYDAVLENIPGVESEDVDFMLALTSVSANGLLPDRYNSEAVRAIRESYNPHALDVYLNLFLKNAKHLISHARTPLLKFENEYPEQFARYKPKLANVLIDIDLRPCPEFITEEYHPILVRYAGKRALKPLLAVVNNPQCNIFSVARAVKTIGELGDCAAVPDLQKLYDNMESHPSFQTDIGCIKCWRAGACHCRHAELIKSVLEDLRAKQLRSQ